jgi:hypothetical protein
MKVCAAAGERIEMGDEHMHGCTLCYLILHANWTYDYELAE